MAKQEHVSRSLRKTAALKKKKMAAAGEFDFVSARTKKMAAAGEFGFVSARTKVRLFIGKRSKGVAKLIDAAFHTGRHLTLRSKAPRSKLNGRAKILVQATAVFGSEEEAKHWLEQPAMGLDDRRPIDLLATPGGMELVEGFLEQLKYGVYV